jgi:cytochrome P450
VYLVSHPGGIRHILQKQHTSYDRNVLSYAPLRLFLGNGLPLSDGSYWLRQRRLMQPAFHKQRINTLATQMIAATTVLLTRWEQYAEQGKVLDIYEEMMHLTLCIAGMALFGLDLGDEQNAIGNAFQAMAQEMAVYVYFPVPPLSIPTPRNRRMRAALRTLDSMIYELILERRKEQTDRGDLLSMLLLARDDDGQAMNEQQLRDEIISLLFAGHETTASTLTWAWYELSRHEKAQERLWEEVERVLHGNIPTIEDVSQLAYGRMVMDEVLRIYPPTANLVRHSLEEDEVCGYRLPANRMVILNIIAAHRNPAYWEQPDLFEPERFSPEHPAEGGRQAYFPFGGGPHLCIGNSFALMEGHIILAMIAQRFQLRFQSDRPVEPRMVLAIQPKGRVPMVLQKRR